MPLLTLRRLVFPCRAGLSWALPAIFAALPVALADPTAAQHININREIFHPIGSLHSDDHAWPPRDSGSEFPVEDLRRIREKLTGDLTPRERSILLRRAASLNLDLGNFSQAIENVEASLATGALTKLETEENYSFLGRLYLAAEPPNIEKSIENLQRYIELRKKPSAEAHFYLGQNLAMLDRFEEAIPHAQKAIELSRAPDEHYYRVLLYCHVRLKQHDRSVSLIERMLTIFRAKDEYLKPLAESYDALGRPRDAFLVHAMRYELGFLDSEADLVKLADLYAAHGNPYRGARLLDKEMKAGRVKKTGKNLRKLGNLWFRAREYEKSRAAYFSQELSTGEITARIGMTCFLEGISDCAERHFRHALHKGALKNSCHVHIVLGHTRNNGGDRAGAIVEFELAAQSKICAEDARQWLEYLKAQARREKEDRIGDRAGPKHTPEQIKSLTAWAVGCQKSALAVSDDEKLAGVAADALKAARAARDAKTAPIRQRKLSDYKWTSENVRRYLNGGALDDARRGLAASKEIPNLLKDSPDLQLVHSCEKLLERRVKALLRAERSVRQADRIAGSIKAKH